MKNAIIHAEATPRNNSRIGAGDWFTRERFRWLDSLAADPKMSPGDFIVGYCPLWCRKRRPNAQRTRK
jgi:hypothetical protein